MLQRALCPLTVLFLLILPATRAAGQPAPSGSRIHVAATGGFLNLDFAVAALPDGGFMAAWTGEGGTRVRSFDAEGDPRSGAVPLQSGRKGVEVEVAFSPAGTGLAVWSQPLDARNATWIFGRRIDADGRPLGEILRLDSGEGLSAFSPRVVVDRAGDFVVAWTVDADEATSIHLRRLAASGGAPGPDVELPESRFFLVRTVQSLASSPSGDLLLAGLGNSELGVIYLLRLGRDLRPLGDEIRIVPGAASGHPWDVQAAFGADGHILAVWETSDSLGRSAVFRRGFTAAGEPTGPAGRLVEGGYSASIAADPAGGFLVSWIDAGEAFAERIESYGARGPRFALEPERLHGSQDLTRLAVTGPGRFVAVWSTAGWEKGLFGQRFATGSPGTLELRTLQTVVPEAGGDVVLEVVRREGNRGTASVSWEVLGGGAVPGEDVEDLSGTVVFADGDSRPRTITVPVLEDSRVEGDEAFLVSLRDAEGARLGRPIQARFDIRDDDAPSPLLAGAGPRIDVTAGSSFLCCQEAARLASGGFVVVWEQLTPRGYHDPFKDLFFRIYDAAGRPVGAREQVDAGMEAEDPKLVPRPDGGFLLLWQASEDPDYDGPYFRVGQRYTRSGKPVGVPLEFPSLAGLPLITGALPDGGFVAVTSRRRGLATTDLVAERYDAAGRIAGVPVMVNERPLSGNRWTDPSFDLAVSASGDFVVGWQRYPVGMKPGGIFLRRFAASGRPLGGETAISPGNGMVLGPWLATLPGGGLAATWMRADGDGWGVFARWIGASGRPLGETFQVADSTAGDQTQPAVAAGPRGEVLIAWRSDDRLLGRLYTPTGERLGSAFAFDPQGDALQSPPILLGTATGYIATWIGSTGQPYPVGNNLRALRLAR